jgi:hypothetical protein
VSFRSPLLLNSSSFADTAWISSRTPWFVADEIAKNDFPSCSARARNDSSRRDYELRPRSQVLVIRGKLVIDRLVRGYRFLLRQRRDVDQMQQQLRALDVAQEAIAQSRSRVRAFNQTGNVGDHERAKVAEIDDAEVRLQSRERIVSDFRTRGGNGRDESRLAGVWKTHEADVRQQFQLELKLTLFAFAAGLVISRRAIRRTGEVRVAETAAAAARCQPAGAVVTQVMQQVACVCVKDLGSYGNTNDQVFAVAARTIRAFAVQPAIGYVARVVTEMKQRVERSVGHQGHVAAASAIAAGWPATGYKLFAPESSNAVTSVTPLNMDLGAIDKHLKLKTTPGRASWAAQASRTGE